MKTVSHPNVLLLKGSDLDLNFESKPVACLVLELASGGELFDYLMFTGYFDELLARTYMRQLVSALECCHQNNVFHRDIK
jgi:serine/threonine protein kinase